MSTIKIISLFGLALNALGVILLFFFGMPLRVPTAGIRNWKIAGPADDRERVLDRIYSIISYFGLGFVLTGTFLQAIAVVEE